MNPDFQLSESVRTPKVPSALVVPLRRTTRVMQPTASSRNAQACGGSVAPGTSSADFVSRSPLLLKSKKFVRQSLHRAEVQVDMRKALMRRQKGRRGDPSAATWLVFKTALPRLPLI
jgi:hypothetical protein